MREKGQLAEKEAAKYLKRLGYKVLEQNYFSRFGEIDIIAEKGEYLVFVEVKFRGSDAFGGGVAAVDRRKQERIKKTAMLYLQKYEVEPAVRFDVVSITSADGKIRKENMEIIENAFC